MSVVLFENRGKHLEYVNQTLASMDIPATKADNNENVAVLKDMDANKIIAVIGFNSDSGTNYLDRNIKEEHKILYMENYSRVTNNEKYIDEIKSLTSQWLLNYLTRSAVGSSCPLGATSEQHKFQVGINVKYDKNNLLRDPFDLIRDTFYNLTKSLEFNKIKYKDITNRPCNTSCTRLH